MIEPETLGFLLSDITRLQRWEFERRISNAGLDLTPGEARALLNIKARAGGRQNEIAERMGIEPMTLSGYIDKLEALGLVERMQDPSDRRAKNVVMTANAEKTLAAISKHTGSLIEDMQQGLDDSEREQLKEMLKKVKANILRLAGMPLTV